MYRYAIFGGTLRSEIPLPELRPAAGTSADWTLHVAPEPPPAPRTDVRLLGSENVIPDVDVRLYKNGASYRMTYEDTGAFDIARDGSTIIWWKPAGARVESAQLDVVNRVLPVALHVSGMLCLHGSAVSLGGQAIAFLAPRHFGKSTLAIALTEIGGRILTDDAVAVELGPPLVVRPGTHSVRLLDDAAQALVGDAAELRAVGAYPLIRRDAAQHENPAALVTKQVLRELPAERLMLEPVPLVAIYMLVPETGGGTVATRSVLSPVRAALSLVEHAKSGALLGGSEAAALFTRSVHAARHVPIYQLTLVRDLERIAEVAATLAQWHGGGTGTQAAVA